MESSKEILKTFYGKCLTVNPGTNAQEVMNSLMADNFISHGSEETKNKQQLIGQVGFFWKLIPDLKWEPQEMISEGNKIVVRSLASGTPKGDFMGFPADGSRSFKIMTIDVHTIENGKLIEVYHLEDWGTAMKQLKG